MDQIAEALLKLTWSELDDFSQRIVEISTDDNDDPNNERYISQCLIDWAIERVKKDKNPPHAAKMAS